MTFIFTIAVHFSTHEELQLGLTEPGLQFVSVLANTEDQATLTAAQMVASRGVMPTRTTVLDVMEA